MDPSSPCPVAFDLSLEAVESEGRALDDVLADVPEGWAGRPTRLPAWDLGALVAHLVRGPTRVGVYLDQPRPAAPELDWLEYWQLASASGADEVAQRALDEAAASSPDQLRQAFAPAWRTAAERARAEGPDRLLPGPFGPMRLDHYLTSRVVELTVHGLDIRAALDLPETPTPPGRSVTTAVLEGLAGGRPDGFDDDVGFVLAATGRIPSDQPGLPVIR